MMPMNGRPFLDFVLGSLADAGLREVALVVAPDHDVVRRYYDEERPPARLRVSYVVQQDALGTANAVLAAESWASGEAFLSVNADNLYPVRALADLASLDEPGLPIFDADALVRTSNIPEDRLRSFALVAVDDRGYLTRIVEKPDEGAALPVGESLISMNCWRFDSRIFAACRDVPRSARGEFELPEAVGLAVRRGVRFKTIPAAGPVLDLSRRADATDVARRLAGLDPQL
jgi:dTDP-glucose pyrophosphorylase